MRFTCWFNGVRGAGRDWVVDPKDMHFSYEFLPTRALHRYARVASLYARSKPRNLLTFHFEPSLWPANLHALRRGAQLAIYVEKSWDSYVKRAWFKEQLKRILFNIPAEVFVPGTDAEYYVREYRRISRSIRSLPHVVDLGYLAGARSQREQSEVLRLLYLGSLIEGKGLAYLMKGIDDVDKSLGPISLRLVGSGNMAAEIDEWAHGCGLEVTRDGFVQASELAPVLAGADVLVFPTLADTYGLVVNEALASGLAVLSSSEVGEIEERIYGGTSKARGIIFRPESSAEITNSIETLLRAPSMLQQMQKAATEYADSSFGLEKVGVINRRLVPSHVGRHRGVRRN